MKESPYVLDNLFTYHCNKHGKDHPNMVCVAVCVVEVRGIVIYVVPTSGLNHNFVEEEGDSSWVQDHASIKQPQRSQQPQKGYLAEMGTTCLGKVFLLSHT